MSWQMAARRATFAKWTPRNIPIADFSKRVEIRIIRIKIRKPTAKKCPDSNKPQLIDGLETKCVVHCVARYYGFTVMRVLSNDRSRSMSMARHVAMYLAKSLTRDSSHKIGKYMGHRNHSTVLTAQYKIRMLMARDDNLRADIERLTHALRGANEAPMVES